MNEDNKGTYEEVRDRLSENAGQGKATSEHIRAVVAEAVAKAMRKGKIGAGEAAAHGYEAFRGRGPMPLRESPAHRL